MDGIVYLPLHYMCSACVVCGVHAEMVMYVNVHTHVLWSACATIIPVPVHGDCVTGCGCGAVSCRVCLVVTLYHGVRLCGISTRYIQGTWYMVHGVCQLLQCAMIIQQYMYISLCITQPEPALVGRGGGGASPGGGDRSEMVHLW